jgi:hypothetical protein
MFSISLGREEGQQEPPLCLNTSNPRAKLARSAGFGD